MPNETFLLSTLYLFLELAKSIKNINLCHMRYSSETDLGEQIARADLFPEHGALSDLFETDIEKRVGVEKVEKRCAFSMLGFHLGMRVNARSRKYTN